MSTETSTTDETSVTQSQPWVLKYLRDHALHALVVVLFVLYPFAYDILVGQFGLTAETLLLQPRTMLTVLWLGLFAMSFDFVSGYTGYLSFGHAAFFGIGAYVVTLGYNGQLPLVPAELPFMTLLVLGGLIAVIAAVLIGLIAFRLSGVYFAMITLGVSEILFVASENLDFLTPGGSDPSDGVTPGTPTDVETFNPELGVPFVDPLQVQLGAFGDTSILGIDITPLVSEVNAAVVVSYFAIGAAVLVSYLVMQRIIHSPFGRVMIAISENEERARAIGYNTFWYKLGAFAVSAFFAAVAGGLFAGFVLATLVSRSRSRKREFAADDRAAEVTGDPVALARALRRIERATDPTWSFAPFSTHKRTDGAAERWLSTHPSTDERVERLRERAEAQGPTRRIPAGPSRTTAGRGRARR
mgnify:CR=1 FL=1